MERAEFAGIRPELLEYLMGISMNNYREYFLATRQAYERDVKRPLYALAEALVPTALAIDEDMEQRPGHIVSRIRRDTRFTKDKSPYRSNMWLSFHPTGRPKSECFGLYYDISPRGAPEFAAHYRVLGEDYKRMDIPDGLDPRLHALYRKKSFYVEHSDGLDACIEQPEYAQRIARGLLLLGPLYHLMMTE